MKNSSYLDKPIEILLIEDNARSVELTMRAFKEWKMPNHLNAVKDGVEALAYLHQEGAFAAQERPDIILLDLTLPKKSGSEVLAEVKEDLKFKQIPIIVLSI